MVSGDGLGKKSLERATHILDKANERRCCSLCMYFPMFEFCIHVYIYIYTYIVIESTKDDFPIYDVLHVPVLRRVFP